MTLAVGYGYELPYLLDLPLPAFDALAASILRVRREALSESGWVHHLASQYEAKHLIEHLHALTGTAKKIEKTEHKAAREAMNVGGNRPRRRGKR